MIKEALEKLEQKTKEEQYSRTLNRLEEILETKINKYSYNKNGEILIDGVGFMYSADIFGYVLWAISYRKVWWSKKNKLKKQRVLSFQDLKEIYAKKTIDYD